VEGDPAAISDTDNSIPAIDDQHHHGSDEFGVGDHVFDWKVNSQHDDAR
jgi:hypothetical protein